MKKKKIGLYFVMVCVLILLAACGRKADYSMLSDLGGVYSSSFNDLDLSIEISGRLSEDPPAKTVDAKLDTDSIEVSTDGPSNNKLLRWGISRRPDNQTPAADPGAPAILEKYGGCYIGDTTKKTIYLTFDEGYENGYTPKILDVLRANNAKAVFFITGPYLKEYPDLVRRMIEEGHTVGNHTIHHPSLPSVDDKRLEEEIMGLERVFNEKFGKNMRFLRPPKGEYSERTLAITQKLGYCNLFWSFAYDDWYKDKSRGADYARNIVDKNLHNGAILLLHAVSKDNAEALDQIIKNARAKGYEIGDANDLIKN